MDMSVDNPHRRGMPQTKKEYKEYKEYKEKSGARRRRGRNMLQLRSLFPR
jgi:hypothetical protein